MRSWWTISLAAAVLALTAGAGWAAQIAIGYVSRAGDPFYERRQGGADGLMLPQRHRPMPGAALGVKDARAIGRATGFSFELVPLELSEDEPLGPALERLGGEGAVAALLDLPVEDIKGLSGFSGFPLFDVTHEGDELRGEACAPMLFHTMPSTAMKTDALAQFLARKNWRRVLVLHGTEAADERVAAAFAASAAKFGLRIADTRRMEGTRDPRRRESANPALLTAEADHDAVFIADEVGDVGRYVGYRAAKPRPVVGSEGLRASGWHVASERFGAPQLSRRFEREAGRPMQEADWAAWAAVRSIVEVVTRQNAAAPAALHKGLTGPDTVIELSKGTPGSFRPWDRQLRQPVMLHTHNAVIDFAPIEGFLHEHNTLDTLGIEKQGSACRH